MEQQPQPVSFVVFDNKTAKSLIMEACQRKRFKASWSSRQIQTLPSVFKSVCTIDGQQLRAEGLGSTKKDAEQVAAYKMLPNLITSGELLELMAVDKGILQEEKRVNATVRGATVNTFKNDSNKQVHQGEDAPKFGCDASEITGEPIGELVTLCLRLSLGTPTYKVTGQTGPSNAPNFTITVTVGSITHSGKGSNKKDAKRIAAFRLLRDLKSKEDRKSKSPPVLMPSSSQISTNEITSSVKDTPEMAKRYGTVTLETSTDSTDDDGSLSSAFESPPQSSSSSSASKREVEHQLDTDDMEIYREDFLKLKRKLAEEDEQYHSELVSSSTAIKRKYELIRGLKLTCQDQSENCVQLIKDFAHVFQHLPPNPTLEEALTFKEFQLLLDGHGGALRLLTWYAEKLKIKLVYSSSMTLLTKTCDEKPITPTSKTPTNEVVFLSIKIPFKDFKLKHQKRLVVTGVGENYGSAKEKAALEGLILLRMMMFDDEN